MVTDLLANILTRIRNAQRAGHKSVELPRSSLGVRVLEVLKTEGFIDGYDERKSSARAQGSKTSSKNRRRISHPCVDVRLKYYSSGEPLIRMLKRVSKPGCRVYSELEKLPHAISGLGVAVVSTSQGVMSDREARKRKIGGEVLAVVG
jgi:small subunit ribosomal protein S8